MDYREDTSELGRGSSDIASFRLLHLNRLEQALEVANAEPSVVASLNDLEEQCGSVLNRLGEDLKKVALVIVVNQYLKLLESLNIFFYLNAGMLKSLPESLVIGVGNCEELNTSLLEGCHCLDDVGGAQGDMLDSSTAVVLDIFLDLRFSLSSSRLINWHLDILVEVCNHDGPEG